MKQQLFVLLLSWLAFSTTHASAQFGTPFEFPNQKKKDGSGIELERERTQLWKVGIRVIAATGPCVGIYGTFAVPVDWPEQDVKVVEEDVSDTVRQTRYRNIGDHVRQVTVIVPRLGFGEKAEVFMTFEVTRRVSPPPVDTTMYRVPKTAPREVRKWLSNSPKIDCRNTKIRMKAKELTADRETAWEKVEAIHDWVQENIQYTNDALKGAVETLDQKRGSHEDLAGLFIALCRASKIPARTVWTPNYCYAEFYLEDEAKEGTWFPCEFKEKTVFGTVVEPYIILQKGENIEVPESKERQRFVAEFLKVKSGSKPTVEFIRDPLGIKR